MRRCGGRWGTDGQRRRTRHCPHCSWRQRAGGSRWHIAHFSPKSASVGSASVNMALAARACTWLRGGPRGPLPCQEVLSTYALSSGICQTITEDTISSGGCCRAFRHTRRWPWPPHTTSTELALAFLGRRALLLGRAVGSFKRSQVLLSSDLCSSELEPWDKLRDPDEEDRSLL